MNTNVYLLTFISTMFKILRFENILEVAKCWFLRLCVANPIECYCFPFGFPPLTRSQCFGLANFKTLNFNP